MTHEELGRALKAAAFLEGEFKLRSGRTSRYYFDKYLFETDPEILTQLAQRLSAFITPQTQRIAGAELGAVALATATSLTTGLPFVIVRNARKADYGTGKLIEGRLERGEQVLLVEDIATSGGQAIDAAQVLSEAGARVQAIVAVIDREEGARAAIEGAGHTFHALFKSSDLGIPVNRPA